MIDKINIRVYALCIKDNKILALHEEYAGDFLTKLPGGGLEFGESMIECLKREFQEELNLDINVTEHFYTQDDFLVSRFRDNEQLITIYYLAEILNEQDLLILDPCIERSEWFDLNGDNPFQLPIDKRVFELAKEKFLK
ncbi:NUDIX domain-containing protein [Epilithonimonas xixisoli]|uniref:ADP-ribose pyrophosphatase YjhB (NUDIX family) n=1 Tax=Epilithonimonas xixisoli TaxID=1476462 RepID=A0A4R8I9L1_9FLAO|nr:NUDIX hydrolase [Epilithonimonas xixisoli]TDX86778.1 ADP-ribose pyrophosphatase YjhB (NUDIX family) [Epilithonimonas xixisoli]